MCGSAEALKKGILRCAQNDRCREGVDPPLRWVLDQIGICRLYKNRSMSSSGTRSGREGSWGGRLKIGVGSKMTVEITKDFAVSAFPSRLFGTFLAETRKVRPRQGPEPSSWEKVMRIRRISFLDNR